MRHCAWLPPLMVMLTCLVGDGDGDVDDDLMVMVMVIVALAFE